MVIDSNNLVHDIIQQQQKIAGMANERVPDADGFVTGLEAATVEEVITEDTDDKYSVEQTEEERQRIIDNAHAEAQNIIEEARKQGYSEGMENARKESENSLSEMRSILEQEYRDKTAALQQEYEDLKAKAEPELVDTLLKVFSKVTHVMAEDKKDIILYLIDGVMRETEASREFLIKVSEDDYSFVDNNRDKIYGATAAEIKIDICKDSRLEKNQCIIETDAGVFDCSLDIQLENLIGEIKLLSCMVE